jgi:hypothetical protein
MLSSLGSNYAGSPQMPSVTVNPIHFGDYSGEQFERLVFAYHLREGWDELEWYGLTGSNLGRDIVGIEHFGKSSKRFAAIQCVNRKTLTFNKAKRDMKKVRKAPGAKPDAFRLVCRANVSATMRDKIKAEGKALGFRSVSIWSGVEFEEKLRLRAEPILQRFVGGAVFPDTPIDLRRFVDEFPGLSDKDALDQMAAVLHRPAFHTHFHCESSLPDFEQAIADTIGALNTGIWETRDGKPIKNIPSIHTLKDASTRAAMVKLSRDVNGIRELFRQRLHDGKIKSCNPGNPNCSMFDVRPEVARELDRARDDVLSAFDAVRANAK